MQNFNNIWKNFLTEGSFRPQNAPKVEKVLREITEDEMTHIVRAIDEMEPSDLAFDELFDGKKRLVLDFKTLDMQTDLGQFMHIWKEMRYEELIAECQDKGWKVEFYHLAVGTRGYVERKLVNIFRQRFCFPNSEVRKLINDLQNTVEKASYWIWLKRDDRNWMET